MLDMTNHVGHDTCLAVYMGIRSFRCRETEKIFNGESSRKFPGRIQRVARRKLKYLNNVKTIQDLRVPPGHRLEKLRGNRAGQYSIRVNDQYRVCFAWVDGEPDAVEIVDYH